MKVPLLCMWIGLGGGGRGIQHMVVLNSNFYYFRARPFVLNFTLNLPCSSLTFSIFTRTIDS